MARDTTRQDSTTRDAGAGPDDDQEQESGVKARLTAARRRFPFLDHVLRTQERYSDVKGSQWAGAVTYFGFLSVFPLLLLAFWAVGIVSRVYDIEDQVVQAIRDVLPVVTTENPAPQGEVSIVTIQNAAGTVGLIGLLGLLYTGLGWLSSMRAALITVFGVPEGLEPNFVLGKVRDLISLLTIGLTLVLTVSIAGGIATASQLILEWLGLAGNLEWLLRLLGVTVGLAASTVLFYAVFRLLARPRVPNPSLWKGAFFGAVGFELLKQAATYLTAAVGDRPAFAVFGIALILLVWINYFSRLVVYAGAWAWSSPRAREARETADALQDDTRPEGPAVGPALAAGDQASASGSHRGRSRAPLVLAGGAAVAAIAVVARRGRS